MPINFRKLTKPKYNNWHIKLSSFSNNFKDKKAKIIKNKEIQVTPNIIILAKYMK
jgi:hypothetical protein